MSKPLHLGGIYISMHRVTFVDESWQLIDNDPSYSSYSDWAHYVKRYTIQVIDPDTNPPSVPKLQSPSNGAETSDTTVSLNWTDSSDSGSGLDHYQVQVDNSSSFSSPEFKAYPTSSNDTTSSLSDGLYYWRVQAVDNVGNWSSWSSDQKFRGGYNCAVSAGPADTGQREFYHRSDTLF